MVDGKKVNRSYTIASSPTRVGYCEITVKREEHGVASRHLHDNVREGSARRLRAGRPVHVHGLRGREHRDDRGRSGHHAADGQDPLPDRRELARGDLPGLFAAKTERDIIFRDELDYLRRRFPNLQVTVTLTRADGTSWSGERGRISPRIAEPVRPANHRAASAYLRARRK